MRAVSKRPRILLLLAVLGAPVTGSLAAQETSDGDVMTTVYGTAPPEAVAMTKGPDVEGIISARGAGRMQVTTAEGTNVIIAINDATRIKASGGFLGLNRNKLAEDSLLNGLPVTVETLQGGGDLVASQIELKNKDLKTATMIRSGTDQRFAEQTAATEALRSRVGDIDQ